MNVFIINAGQIFSHSGGKFNDSLTDWTNLFFENTGSSVRIFNINDGFEASAQVKNFKWADLIVYHTPIWWFQLPNRFKLYIDNVFNEGHRNGMYSSDGRSRKNPAINYGTGGLMHGKKYMVTTTWNAPDTAFTLEGEFFDQIAVDDGILFGFHKMNQFVDLQRVSGMHFHDLEKNATPKRVDSYHQQYIKHLESQFPTILK
ncbi:MAG: NAD(P)H-dependent oxidoreductase [Sphingobacterium sp.]|uniref:NAD(P)H-dependent oxidoreductase n=1 Tax=Sphingobacterium sp. JB170 TaxID=1434842 RepID=UPI00097F60BE|nr:NAD(P)H-dependent oxidoreductase [Sphingobacterium sp. JB170]SJN48850.1 NAD(P)H dehydrogenase (quinone) [Sphingobacterium sp. JB170]